MADQYIRVERTVRLVTFVPFDEEHYYGMAIDEAVASERYASPEDKLSEFAEELSIAESDRISLSESVIVVTKEEAGEYAA
jgi:hypothetical protein